MSNPHPVKQRKPDAMSDRMKAKFSTYVPRQRLPNEATGPLISVMSQPEYKPPAWVAAR